LSKIRFFIALYISIILLSGGFGIYTSPDRVEGLDVKGDIIGNPTVWSGHVNITGHIYINSGANLTIDPGTEVEFKGLYNIYVNSSASIYSNGSSGNEVLIYHQSQLGWGGIILNDTSSTAIFRHTNINHSINGIQMDKGGTLLVDSCVLQENLYGVQGSYMDPVIRNSTFNNSSFPIFFLLNVNGTVTNNKFQNNTNSVIWQNSQGQPNFDNNLVEYTIAGSNPTGVQLSNTNIHFTNNTIRNVSGYGVSLSQCGAFIYKNVFKNNGFPSSEYGGILVSSTNTAEVSKIESNDFTSNAIGVTFERDPQPWSGANISGDFIDNRIYDNTQYGVMIRNFSYPNFDNNNVFNNYRGIGVFDSTPIISNSTVTGNIHADFWLDYIASGPCAPVSLNTAFNTVNFSSYSINKNLKVKWILNINVTESMAPFNPVPFTEVTVKSSLGDIAHKKNTDATGRVKWLHTMEKVMWLGVIKNYSPYEITVENKSVPRIYVKKTVKNVPVTKSTSITIPIDRNYAPSAVTDITPLETHDSTPVISWSPSSDVNGDPVTYYFRLGTVPGWDDIIPEAAVTGTNYAVISPLIYGMNYYITLKAGDNRFANSTATTIGLNITNNRPSMPIITTTPLEGSIVTDQNISVVMTTPSFDDADEVNIFGETIRYTVYVDINNIRKSSYTKLYIPKGMVNFEIDHHDFDKGDEINISVIPYDGHGDDWNASGNTGAFRHPDNGTAALVTLHVENSAPRINSSIALDDIVMNEDSEYELQYDFQTIFRDPDKDQISFEYETTENIDIEYIPASGRITIRPRPDYFSPAGQPDIVILKANDSDGGITEISFYVAVLEVNDLPMIHVHTPLTAYQDKPFYINITTTDPADPQDSGNLYLSTNYDTWDFSNEYPVLKDSPDNKSYYFIPRNADVGIFELEVNATDGRWFNTVTIEIEVLNINDRPEKPVIISPMGSNGNLDQIYFTTEIIDFEAILDDLDLYVSNSTEILNVSWTSNVSGLNLGNTARFNTKIPYDGYHNITVTVTDSAGLANSAHINLFVVDPFLEDLPKTLLVLPEDQNEIRIVSNKTSITLNWEPKSHKYSDFFVYDVYLDIVPNTQNRIVVDLNVTEFSLELDAGETYYWWVIPKLGGKDGVSGECFSGKWQFKIEDISQHIYDFEIKLEPSEFVLLPGEAKIVTVTISNTGNAKDFIDVEFLIQGEIQGISISQSNISSLEIEPGTSAVIYITVTADEKIEPGIVVLKADASSQRAVNQGKIIHRKAEITVDINELIESQPEDFSTIIYSVLAVAVVVIIILIILLFIKIEKNKVLTNVQRRVIFNTIKDQPGIHFREIMRVHSLTPGTLSYHLNILEKNSYIKSIQKGEYRCFYTFDDKSDFKIKLSTIQQKILFAINENPGISLTELTEAVGKNKMVLNYHTNILEDVGAIIKEKKGRVSIFFVTNVADYEL
jgi:parallel beta-helix repeat protein